MFQEGAEEATGDEYYQIIGQGAQVINPNSFFFKSNLLAMQTLQIVLQPGEQLHADPASFCYSSFSIVFDYGGIDVAAWLQRFVSG